MSTDITKGEKDESKDSTDKDLAQAKKVLDEPVFAYREGAYKESDDHVPDPLFQTGYMDTTGTAGGANDAIGEVSPIFEVARVQNMRQAARALDPDDDSVPAELVNLPQGSVTVQGTAKTAEEGRREVFSAVLKAAENPPTIGGPTPEQRKAAEEDSSVTDARKEEDKDASDSDSKTEQKPSTSSNTTAQGGQAKTTSSTTAQQKKSETGK